MWVVFLGSVLEFGLVGIILYKLGHKIYLSCKREEMVYENIVKQCKKKKISVSALEKAAGLGNGTIGGWRTSSPTLEKLQAVADALGVKINKLLEEKN